MKRVLIFILLTIINCAIYAQSNRAINIYYSEGHEMYFMTDIDSITHDANCINICINGQMFDYSTNVVDSIVWTENTATYFFPIKEESLEGWQEGYMNNEGCFIVCRQEDDGGYFAYIGQKDNLDDGITLKFNEDMEIQSIFSNKGVMSIMAGDDNKTYAFYFLQDGIQIEEISNVVQHTHKPGIRKRSISSALNIICSWANNALTAGDFANLLSNGNGYLSTFLGNLLIPSLMRLPSYGNLGLSFGLNYLEKKYEDHFHDLLNDYMGSPMIWISDIDEGNAPNYKIQVNIEGLNTMCKPISCSIHTGLAVKEGISNVTYDNCDYTLKEHEIKADEVYNAELKAKRKVYYYLRPFAIVKVDGIGDQFPLTRQKYLWGGPEEPIITYGDVDNIYYNVIPTVTTGECISITDKTAVVKCSYNNAEEFECGVMVSCGSDTIKFTTCSNDGEQEISISGLQPATTYNYWAYVEVDGVLKNGEVKSFTTDLPDLSGTWTCTERNSDGTIDEIWTITLNKGGGGSANNGTGTYNNVSWSIGADGRVYISIVIYIYNTGFYPYNIQDLSGVVDNLQNPTRIEGEGRRMVGNSITEHNYYTTFVMTR